MSAFLCVVLFSVQVIIAGSIAVAAKNLHLPTVSVHTSMHIQHNSLKTATTEYGKIFTVSVNATVEVPCHRNRTALSLTSFKNHWVRLNAAGCYTSSDLVPDILLPGLAVTSTCNSTYGQDVEAVLLIIQQTDTSSHLVSNWLETSGRSETDFLYQDWNLKWFFLYLLTQCIHVSKQIIVSAVFLS